MLWTSNPYVFCIGSKIIVFSSDVRNHFFTHFSDLRASQSELSRAICMSCELVLNHTIISICYNAMVTVVRLSSSRG